MAAGPVNRALLEANFQTAGQIYDDTKTEGAFDVIADQVDENWDYLSSLVNTSVTPYPSFFNRQSIINGNMEVAQRGTSATVSTGSATYVVDRMRSINNGSGVNSVASQVAVSDLNGSNYGMQIVHAGSPTSGGALMHVYTIEARDSYKLAGQQRTVSINVKGVQGMNKATLTARYRTTEGAISNGSTIIASSAETPISSSAWTRISVTYTVPSRTTLTTSGCIGFQIVFSKTTAEASGDGAIITQWLDNHLDVVLNFPPRSFDEEKHLCQRYYEKSYPYDIVPTTNTFAGVILQIVPSNTIINNQFYGTVYFKRDKRTTPTVSIYSIAGSGNAVSNNVGTSLGANSGTFFAASASEKHFHVKNTNGASVTTTNNEVYFHYVADCELT